MGGEILEAIHIFIHDYDLHDFHIYDLIFLEGIGLIAISGEKMGSELALNFMYMYLCDLNLKCCFQI